jgi:hypothetical protein
VEKSPRLNWATQVLTVAYNGACSPGVCQNDAKFLWRLFLQEKKPDGSLHLDVVEITCIT